MSLAQCQLCTVYSAVDLKGSPRIHTYLMGDDTLENKHKFDLLFLCKNQFHSRQEIISFTKL